VTAPDTGDAKLKSLWGKVAFDFAPSGHSDPGDSKERVGASVAAGGVSKGGGMGPLLLCPLGIEEAKDAANRPITHRNPKDEGNHDGEKQKEGKQERRHIPLILQPNDGG